MNGVVAETEIKKRPKAFEREKEALEHELVLFNDDVNTFDWVIVSLMEVCEHTLEQAEQCALITHHRGKCTVASGGIKELQPRCSSLLNRGLSAEIL